MIFSLKRKPIVPNQISTIQSPLFHGRIGLVACPGVRIGGGTNQKVAKNIKADIQEMVDWGASGVVTLVEEHELSIAGVSDLPERLKSAGLWWRHLPMMDMYIPEEDFEHDWLREGARIRNLLKHGESVIIHCYAGLGRTGLLAAKLLVEFGMEPQAAIDWVRESNKRRIQTKEQADYIRGLTPP
ncbi:MAG: dual specificity protein phosphatase family protein [Gammaproteobacteria bacterium]|nr:dual specificity protein phosphatase family protein [Gammaproteobacteria bacterium]